MLSLPSDRPHLARLHRVRLGLAAAALSLTVSQISITPAAVEAGVTIKHSISSSRSSSPSSRFASRIKRPASPLTLVKDRRPAEASQQSRRALAPLLPSIINGVPGRQHSHEQSSAAVDDLTSIPRSWMILPEAAAHVRFAAQDQTPNEISPLG